MSPFTSLRSNARWIAWKKRVAGTVRGQVVFQAASSLKPYFRYGKISRKDWPLFTQMDLEITSSCNRDCSFCPRYGDRSGVRKTASGRAVQIQMPSSEFRSIVDEASRLGFQGPVCLHRLSEPFLDSRYLELATYARQQGMRLVENTNGDPLRRDVALCRALDGLLETLVVGLYDYETESEKRAEMRFWLERFSKTRVQFSLPKEYRVLRIHSELHSSSTPTLSVHSLQLPCTQPLKKLLIRYDGVVSFCCEDDLGLLEVGNAFESSLKDIWWSERRVTMAQDLLKPGGRLERAPCCQCYAPLTVRGWSPKQ